MLFIQFPNKFIVIFLSLLISCNILALTVGTYNAPPFSMREDGEDIGLATEAVRNILQKASIDDYKIINYPLARGLAELSSGRIDIYYPYIVDAKDMHNQPYELIGPISRYRIALFVRKDYQQPVSLADMQNLVLSAERGSVDDLILQKNKISIEQATKPVSCLRMVLAERVVACAIGTLPGMYAAAINNLSEQLRYVDTDEYAEMYLALGPSLSKEDVAKIKATFEKLKRENFFQKQQIDYEKKFSVFIRSLS